MTVRRAWALLLLLALSALAALAAAAPGAAPRAESRAEPLAARDGDDGDDDDDELALNEEESRNVRPRAFPAGADGAYNALPSGFRATPSLHELAGYARPALAPQQQQQAQQLVLYSEQPRPHQRPQQAAAGERGARPQQLQRLQAQQQALQEAEEEEEREEPDRLAQLLQQSKFDCVGKQGGYYADQELACEVFHYCQDSVKHSWICPDGFTFHQVHLICMPPTQDSICQKSAKYHFVNEYLYRPVNAEEVQRKPNVSLRYSDRYYPQEVYHDDRYEQDDDEEEEPARPAARQQTAPQVFRSAEEVNIPLGQRRPLAQHAQHAPHAARPYEFDF